MFLSCSENIAYRYRYEQPFFLWRYGMLRTVFFVICMVPALVFAGMSKGEKLVRKLFKNVQERNFDAIEDHTASYFQRIEQGGVFNKCQELAAFKALTLQSYSLSNFKQTKKHGILTVTFFATTTTIVNGKTVTESGLRLAVWQKVGDDLKRIAYAVSEQ